MAHKRGRRWGVVGPTTASKLEASDAVVYGNQGWCFGLLYGPQCRCVYVSAIGGPTGDESVVHVHECHGYRCGCWGNLIV